MTDVTGVGIRNLLAGNLRKSAGIMRFGNGLPRQSADWLAMTGFFDSLRSRLGETAPVIIEKICPFTSIGGRDSVKGNRQGSLSRPITRRSDQNRKIKCCFYFAILLPACQKSTNGLFGQAGSRLGETALWLLRYSSVKCTWLKM